MIESVRLTERNAIPIRRGTLGNNAAARFVRFIAELLNGPESIAGKVIERGRELDNM